VRRVARAGGVLCARGALQAAEQRARTPQFNIETVDDRADGWLDAWRADSTVSPLVLEVCSRAMQRVGGGMRACASDRQHGPLTPTSTSAHAAGAAAAARASGDA
jgi:hypothetical protein